MRIRRRSLIGIASGIGGMRALEDLQGLQKTGANAPVNFGTFVPKLIVLTYVKTNSLGALGRAIFDVFKVRIVWIRDHRA